MSRPRRRSPRGIREVLEAVDRAEQQRDAAEAIREQLLDAYRIHEEVYAEAKPRQ